MATTDIFRSMIAYWKSFDLQKLQEELDRTASVLAVRSEETDISRQLLLQKSRDFKRNSPEDVQKTIAPLLKSFQSEIDELLRRSKLAESAFLSIYKKVIRMPDMLPVLMAAEQLQLEVERLTGCSAGFFSDEMKETGKSNVNNCTNDPNSLNFESSETCRDVDNCINSSHENSFLTTDTDSPLNNFTADSMGKVAERLDMEEKDVFLQQNSSVHDQSGKAAIGNSDVVALCDDNHSSEMPADLQGRRASSANLQPCDDLDSGRPDRTNTRQNEVAADDSRVEKVDRESSRSEDCRMEIDRRMSVDASRVVHKQQTEPDTDLPSSDCKSSAEFHSISCSDEQSAKLGTVEQNGECDHRIDQIHDLVSDRPWNETGRLKDEEEAKGSWSGKQKFTGQSGDAKGLSDIVISNVESLASEIGQEMVCSYQNSQHSVHDFWLHNVKNGKAEGSSSVDIHSTYAAQHSPEYPVTCVDLMPENLKIESADELALLDTVDISCRIREILSFHNLGQRLFARYVLGLSQGTVSELLSKPKPWDKLTEKGRESYRKMHQWASDERNIQILKSLSSPKCSVSSSSSGQTDSAAEERIAQILSEAQAAMQRKQEDVDKFQSSLKLTPKVSELQVVEAPNETEKSSRKHKRKGNGQTSGSRNDTSRHYKAPTDSENLTREIVARIYQEELEKLAQVAEASGNMAELLGYRQELARLSQEWAKRPCKPEAHRSVIEDKENHKETVGEITLITKRHLNDSGETTDKPQDLSISGSAEAGHHSHEGINLSVVRSDDSSTSLPGVLPVSLLSSCSGNGLLSPLQRMQSIANSLTLQSSLPTALQPTRVVLPPISQEQFDLHANINTDDLVKRIKDVLSQYSISQRLFGECVLGLSQGSVSDLLARPKPWHLLTQKGREPFIRMQMFADDPEAVPKLVASQYRVPTEKLMRSNSSSNLDGASHGMVSDSSGEVAEPCSAPLTASPSCKPFRPLSTGRGDAAPSSSTVPPATVFSTTTSSSQSTSGTLPASFGRSLTNGVGFPSVEVAMVPSVLSLFGATFLSSAQFSPVVNMDVHHIYGSAAGTSSEAGAGTSGPELDTQATTARVKEVLQLNNLGQKLFGEAVLELSQGSVSELLSKPKPWHMLSLKGREPFVKMQIWLQDPLGVQKLHSYQTHMSGRRRKSGCDGSTTDKPGNQKKPRLFFSEEQKESLKAAYLRDPYPNQLAIEQLASELDIGVKTVINWFHNHRMRAKQHHGCNSPTSTTAGSPCSSILTRIKSEVPDDLTEQSETRSSIVFPQEDNSASSSSCRSRCDSGPLSGFDVRPSKLASSIADPRSISSFHSSDAFSFSKNSNLEIKRNELNKRKRARPHRLYSSAADAAEHRVAAEHQSALDTVIDLSVNRSVGDVKNVRLRTDLLSQGQEANQDKTLKVQTDDSSLQQRSDVADVKTELPDDWSDSRVRNIEKLQHNLLLAPSDDWEF